MATTVTTAASTSTEQPKADATSSTSLNDEKKDEEELNMMSELDELFEQYRVIEDLAFDITKKEKSQKLHEVKKQIASIIERIEQRYPYKQTLTLKTNASNQSNTSSKKQTKHKGKKSNDSNINNTKNSAANSASSAIPSLSALSTAYNKDSSNNDKLSNDCNATISRAQYLYFKGRYFKINGNVDTASPLLMESIKLDPELIECWNTLGDIYYARNEILAAKYCFESALEYDRYNKISYLSLSKILRKPMSSDDMENLENYIESLILAKQALKYSKKSNVNKSDNKQQKSNAMKDGELWFNLGNAYLMTFLNCANGWKLESSIKLEREREEKEKEKENKAVAANHHNNDSNNTNNNKKSTSSQPQTVSNGNNNRSDEKEKEKEKEKEQSISSNLLDGLDDNFFADEYEQESIRMQIRREIEAELNDEANNLLHHVYIRKCLGAYKCAATKCTVNKHASHPDLYCNRSHLHIYQENYHDALQDLKLSIKYSAIDDSEQCQAKLLHDELLPKLCKISKQIANSKGNKMQKKIQTFTSQIKQFMRQCSDYYTTQLHYDLVEFAALNDGLNGGNVVVMKIMALVQPAKSLPFHFLCTDNAGSMFVLSFYLGGNAQNYIFKVANQGNVINASTLIAVANPVKRHIKFTHGSKNIDFHTITFQKPQDICIGGRFYFNQ